MHNLKKVLEKFRTTKLIQNFAKKTKVSDIDYNLHTNVSKMRHSYK